MDVFDKYNISFLDLKQRDRTVIKIIYIENKSLMQKNKIRSILCLKDDYEADYFGYKIDLHYIGDKKNGRPHLVRCNSPENCLPCEIYRSKNPKVDLKPFSKIFFYGIFEDEIVYFSLNLNNGFKTMTALEDFKACNPVFLEKKAVCLFKKDSFRGYARACFEQIKIDQKFEINPELIERVKNIPPLEAVLSEKYPDKLDEDEIKLIKKLK